MLNNDPSFTKNLNNILCSSLASGFLEVEKNSTKLSYKKAIVISYSRNLSFHVHVSIKYDSTIRYKTQCNFRIRHYNFKTPSSYN